MSSCLCISVYLAIYASISVVEIKFPINHWVSGRAKLFKMRGTLIVFRQQREFLFFGESGVLI